MTAEISDIFFSIVKIKVYYNFFFNIINGKKDNL